MWKVLPSWPLSHVSLVDSLCCAIAELLVCLDQPSVALPPALMSPSYSMSPGLGMGINQFMANMHQNQNQTSSPHLVQQDKGKGKEKPIDFDSAFAEVTASLASSSLEADAAQTSSTTTTSMDTDGAIKSDDVDSFATYEAEFQQWMDAQREDGEYDYGVGLQQAWEGGLGDVLGETSGISFDEEGLPNLGIYQFGRSLMQDYGHQQPSDFQHRAREPLCIGECILNDQVVSRRGKIVTFWRRLAHRGSTAARSCNPEGRDGPRRIRGLASSWRVPKYGRKGGTSHASSGRRCTCSRGGRHTRCWHDGSCTLLAPFGKELMSERINRRWPSVTPTSLTTEVRTPFSFVGCELGTRSIRSLKRRSTPPGRPPGTHSR
jgi:hypothetical protein